MATTVVSKLITSFLLSGMEKAVIAKVQGGTR